MNYTEIEARAKDILTQYGYSMQSNDYVDIVDLARKLGFLVGNANLPDNEDGFLAIRPSKEDGVADKVIGVNANHELSYKRFVIAHELAHWNLHYTQGTAFLHREGKKGKSQDENDADFFAAVLLMPTDSFKRVYKEMTKTEKSHSAICLKLASLFKVPLESVLRRIDEVGLGIKT